MAGKSIAILMATYNGEKYIREQLESLRAQSVRGRRMPVGDGQGDSADDGQGTTWTLYVRDDGSTDGTMEILEEYLRDSDFPVEIVTSGSGDGSNSGSGSAFDSDSASGSGAGANFAALYQWVKANQKHDYYMFCDQDDVWLPEKIEAELRALQGEELYAEVSQTDSVSTGVQAGAQTNADAGATGVGGPSTVPLLVHTDLRVVDENLTEMAPSYISYRSLNPSFQDLNHLLAQNNITGCTMMWNQALMDVVDLDVEGSYLHDWWMSLSAAALGKIIYVPEATILYRQHQDNQVGATKVNSLSYIIARALDRDRIRRTLTGSMVQAEAFLQHYSLRLSEDQKEVLSAYASMQSAGKLKKLFLIRKYHFEKQGRVQKIAQKVFV